MSACLSHFFYLSVSLPYNISLSQIFLALSSIAQSPHLSLSLTCSFPLTLCLGILYLSVSHVVSLSPTSLFKLLEDPFSQPLYHAPSLITFSLPPSLSPSLPLSLLSSKRSEDRITSPLPRVSWGTWDRQEWQLSEYLSPGGATLSGDKDGTDGIRPGFAWEISLPIFQALSELDPGNNHPN